MTPGATSYFDIYGQTWNESNTIAEKKSHEKIQDSPAVKMSMGS